MNHSIYVIMQSEDDRNSTFFRCGSFAVYAFRNNGDALKVMDMLHKNDHKGLFIQEFTSVEF